MAYNPERETWVSGLKKSMTLTPLDYTAPQNYIMRCWGFQMANNRRETRQAAIEYLLHRFEVTLTRLPFLGGVIIHGKDGGLPRLVYPDNDEDLNIHRFPHEVFDAQRLDSTKFPSYNKLTEAGIPASAFVREVFWLLPKTGPSPGDAVYPVTLRATFFFGGLVLGFSFHHGVIDGMACKLFMEHFTGLDPSLPPNLDYTSILERQKQGFLAYASQVAATTTVNIHAMPDYDFNVPATPPFIAPAVAEVFAILATRASDLHAQALKQLRAAHNDDQSIFISISDVICALSWISMIRVRLRAGRITPDETSRFATAVSVREFLDPGVLGDKKKDKKEETKYLGNMWLRALASSTVGEVTGTQSDNLEALAQPVTPELVGKIAWLIRQAVAELRKPETLARHITIAARATGCYDAAAKGNKKDDLDGLTWPDVDAAIRRSIARHSTGVDMSVGVATGAEVEFDIPGVVGGRGPAAWERRGYVAFDGFVSILPRKGVNKGDKDWEIWVALRQEDMDALAGETELGGWVSGKFPEGSWHRGGGKCVL